MQFTHIYRWYYAISASLDGCRHWYPSTMFSSTVEDVKTYEEGSFHLFGGYNSLVLWRSRSMQPPQPTRAPTERAGIGGLSSLFSELQDEGNVEEVEGGESYLKSSLQRTVVSGCNIMAATPVGTRLNKNQYPFQKKLQNNARSP